MAKLLQQWILTYYNFSMSNLSPVLLLLLVAGVLAGPFKPTSDFWSKKLNYTVTFESYAGSIFQRV